VTSSWFYLSTLNYDARSTTHQLKAVFTRQSSCHALRITTDGARVVLTRCLTLSLSETQNKWCLWRSPLTGYVVSFKCINLKAVFGAGTWDVLAWQGVRNNVRE